MTEALGIHIEDWNLVVFIAYRSPDNNRQKSAFNEFSQPVKSMNQCLCHLPAPTPDVILGGDLNLPNADWDSGESLGSKRIREELKTVQALHELAMEHFLIQQIELPIHRDGNVLDVLFTDNSNLIHSYTCTYSGQSDHNIVEVKSLYKTTTSHKEQHQPEVTKEDTASFFSLNFFNEDIDWERINSAFKEVDWTSKFQGLSVNAMFVKFFEICLSTASDHIPNESSHIKQEAEFPDIVCVLMRIRQGINKQLCQSPTDSRRKSLKACLIEIERKLQQSYREQQEAQEERAVNNIKMNPKYFYSYVKSFSKIKIGVGPLLSSARTLISDPRKMAETLSAQYASLFSQPKFTDKDLSGLFPDEMSSPEKIVAIPFTEVELMKAMSDVQPNSAAGPDGFPAMLFKKCSSTLAHPLFMIWRDSLDSGIIPDTCKTANITPIHKGKSRAVPKNYRPVALTSLLIKTFEKVVRRHLVNHMKVNELFNPSQPGFRNGRSCLKPTPGTL